YVGGVGEPLLHRRRVRFGLNLDHGPGHLLFQLLAGPFRERPPPRLLLLAPVSGRRLAGTGFTLGVDSGPGSLLCAALLPVIGIATLRRDVLRFAGHRLVAVAGRTALVSVGWRGLRPARVGRQLRSHG